MQLFYTDSNFIFHGLARPAIPFLCGADMELVAAPNSYLLYLATIKGRTRSPQTWRTYGNHLYEFFSFLEVNDIDWSTASTALLAVWRDSMLERECRASTVNQRLRCIASFYRWATDSDLVRASPISTADVRVSKHRGFLAHVSRSELRFKANELTMQSVRPPPKFLTLEKANLFIEALPTVTLKLIAYLALLTGMRRDELTRLNYRVLPNPCGMDSQQQVPMKLDGTITPTKGKKTRIVMVPYDLAVALWNYFCSDWITRNAKHIKRSGRESECLFLSESGNEYSIRYLNNAFSKATAKSNVKCSPHMLRHTYGTYEFLRVSSKFNEDKALLWVRERMGHSSISTTEIYIHASDLIRNDQVDGYQLEILRALKNGY